MSLADLVGVLRALSVVPIAAAILADARPIALGVFAAAAASDALDGWLARRTGSSSARGALIDPLADKLLVVGTAAALALAGLLDPVLVAGIAAREGVVAVLRVNAYARGARPATRAVAKLKTAMEMAGLAILIAVPVPEAAAGVVMLAVALAIGVLTMPHYLPRSTRRLT